MDNNQAQGSQNNQTLQQKQPPQAQVANQRLDEQKQLQPAVSASAGQKEQEPILSTQVSEYITSSEKAPEIPDEVREAGVEEVAEKDPLANLSQTGVKASGHFTKPKTEPEGIIKSPLTKVEALSIEKKESKKNSVRWLATLVKKIFKRNKGGET